MLIWISPLVGDPEDHHASNRLGLAEAFIAF
jgi:hypothetical protein